MLVEHTNVMQFFVLLYCLWNMFTCLWVGNYLTVVPVLRVHTKLMHSLHWLSWKLYLSQYHENVRSDQEVLALNLFFHYISLRRAVVAMNIAWCIAAHPGVHSFFLYMTCLLSVCKVQQVFFFFLSGIDLTTFKMQNNLCIKFCKRLRGSILKLMSFCK
jgi:hypothetical protein